MVRKRDPFWKYANDLGNGRFFCHFCENDFPGGISRVKSHLSGRRGRDIVTCSKVPVEIKLEAQQAIDVVANPTKRAKFVPASNNVLQGESTSGSSSSHMPNLCKGQDKRILDKRILDKQLAKFIILKRICFDAIQSPLFKDFLKGIAEHGPGYELPSSLTFKSQLVPDIKSEVEEYVRDVIKYSANTGCTLIVNKWTRKSSNTSISIVVDIFVYTPQGVVCMDPSGIMYGNDKMSGDIRYFKEAMVSIMKLIGSKNVVQFIINNGNNDDNDEVNETKDMLLRNYPWIYQTPCATDEIGLLLRKIYDVPFVYNTIEVAKWIVLYIYKHKVNVSLRRVHKKKDFIASQFFLLTSLLEVESELQDLQVSILTLSSDWGKPLNLNQVTELFRGAEFIDYVIRCKEFWSRGKLVAQVMQPLFQALCLVNCDSPTSGYLYEMMERVQAAVKKCCDNNHILYDVSKILSEVRSDIIHPIHVGAAFLNPIYMCSEKFKETDEMKNGVEHILKHLVAVEEKEDFMNQVIMYRMKDSIIFTPEATMMLKTSHPRIWWECYGNLLPVLQKYAIQILSQPCSSSLCKQFQLQDSYLNDRAFMLNAMMMERYKSLEIQIIKPKPIILDKLEVSYDGYYQHLWDEDDDWDDDYAYEFSYLTDSYVEDKIKDPTGSWLDSWPKK